MTRNESFEKFKLHNIWKTSANYDHEVFIAEQAWEAATAEANKRIDALEKLIIQQDKDDAEWRKQVTQLQANNNTLREGIAEIAAESQDTYTNAALTKLLATTPAEALQAHDDELIEKCANVASLAFDSNDIVDAILALKGK